MFKPSLRGSGLVVAPTAPWATVRYDGCNRRSVMRLLRAHAGDLAIPRRVLRTHFLPVSSGETTPGQTSGTYRLVRSHCPGSTSNEVYRDSTLHQPTRGGSGPAPVGTGVCGHDTPIAQWVPDRVSRGAPSPDQVATHRGTPRGNLRRVNVQCVQMFKPSLRGSGLVVAPTAPWATGRQRMKPEEGEWSHWAIADTAPTHSVDRGQGCLRRECSFTYVFHTPGS